MWSCMGSEEDSAEAARRLQVLTGKIAGTIAKTDADALKGRLANFVRVKDLTGGQGQN